jgi:hypothetical protein
MRGQSTVELAILIAAVAAALVAMAIYLQRGYQGYLRTASQTHGVQFDPNSTFDESRRLNNYARNQVVDITSSEPGTPAVVGQLPGRILTTKVNTTTDWNVSRTSAYEAN